MLTVDHLVHTTSHYFLDDFLCLGWTPHTHDGLIISRIPEHNNNDAWNNGTGNARNDLISCCDGYIISYLRAVSSSFLGFFKNKRLNRASYPESLLKSNSLRDTYNTLIRGIMMGAQDIVIITTPKLRYDVVIGTTVNENFIMIILRYCLRNHSFSIVERLLFQNQTVHYMNT